MSVHRSCSFYGQKFYVRDQSDFLSRKLSRSSIYFSYILKLYYDYKLIKRLPQRLLGTAEMFGDTVMCCIYYRYIVYVRTCTKYIGEHHTVYTIRFCLVYYWNQK